MEHEVVGILKDPDDVWEWLGFPKGTVIHSIDVAFDNIFQQWRVWVDYDVPVPPSGA